MVSAAKLDQRINRGQRDGSASAFDLGLCQFKYLTLSINARIVIKSNEAIDCAVGDCKLCRQRKIAHAGEQRCRRHVAQDSLNLGSRQCGLQRHGHYLRVAGRHIDHSKIYPGRAENADKVIDANAMLMVMLPGTGKRFDTRA